MFLKYILFVVLSVTVLCAEGSKPKVFVLENLKRLDDLVNKKKNTINQPVNLGMLFDDVADDTKKLLADLDKHGPKDKPGNQEIIAIITRNIAAMERLLALSIVPVELEQYCGDKRMSDDPNRSTICCNRPAKKVSRPMEPPTRKPHKTNEDDENNPLGNH